MGYVLDAALIALVACGVWLLWGEGIWGAALNLINILLAGLIAFSYYEMLARLLDGLGAFIASFADCFSVIVLFSAAYALLRFLTEFLGPRLLTFPGWLDQIGRLVFGLAASWYLVGMLLCALEMAPVHKQFLGYRWKDHALFGAGIDRFWLGFVRSSTQHAFDFDPPRPFDPSADFIRRYHNHRPYGRPDPTMPH